MREAALWLYQLSGLRAVASPWLASTLVYAALGVYLVPVGYASLALTRPHKAAPRGAAQILTALSVVAAFAVGTIAATGLQSFIAYEHPSILNSSSYDVFTFTLFALAVAMPLLINVRARGWNDA
jgi:hypothetical protein